MARSGSQPGGVKPPRINGKKILALGVPNGPGVSMAIRSFAGAAEELGSASEAKSLIKKIVEAPHDHLDDPHFAELAAFLEAAQHRPVEYVPRDRPAPWRQWGTDIDAGAVAQMGNAVTLPVAVRGALMPDAHQGYGLPIGGVLATDNTVIPYAVGVDIACRMKLTVLDVGVDALERNHSELCSVLQSQTVFGKGTGFQRPRDHEVLDAENWDFSPLAKRLRKTAHEQIGSSGSGNHFCEFGELTLNAPALGLDAGTYLAVLSHSGSRGPGAQFANHFTKVAMDAHPELPAELRYLAWLDLDDEAGQEYWAAMELMGRFASANHEIIHDNIARALKSDVVAAVENHHNFAWTEQHDGQEVIVHRKGATPAGEGVMAVIPGSMATPGFVVRGKGIDESLRSAAHGAGRAMSRATAKASYRWKQVRPQLEEARVTLLSAGIDEVPGAYKDINSVMAAQTELVDVVARFDPRIVRMADGGEEPED